MGIHSHADGWKLFFALVIDASIRQMTASPLRTPRRDSNGAIVRPFPGLLAPLGQSLAAEHPPSHCCKQRLLGNGWPKGP
jgi:hypothetical protein